MELIQDGSWVIRHVVLTCVHLCSWAMAIRPWHSLVEDINDGPASIHLAAPIFLALIIVDFFFLLVNFVLGDVNFELVTWIQCPCPWFYGIQEVDVFIQNQSGVSHVRAFR